ncbi:Coenzyme F420 hydrogenase/dehydrogenase, beta subunit C-terminal domain [Streptomyces sp. NPDC005134]|uniref:Coenzyme F420 hydrogenase/dehydrogenase, beta subunit C-terminal domain n=1 Tax=Streptomyces sp. NPDC005098 TaxID=3154560 RepID=UPI0033B199DF
MRNPKAVVDVDLCVGCGGCKVAFPGKVRMTSDSRGFVVADQAEALTPREGRRFAAFCPATGYAAEKQQASHRHPVWGEFESVAAGWAQDAAVRSRASSGGVLTAIAGGLLDRGEVDAVVTIKGGTTEVLSNVPMVARERGDLLASAGSRYSPGAPALALHEVDTSATVAFIGKPCDVAMARRLVSDAPDDFPTISVWLSFFCAGTPSWGATRELIEELGGDESSAASVRYRGEGWPGKFVVTQANGTRLETTYEHSWGRHLNKQLCTRCKLCRDGVGTKADIVAADAWDSDERGYPLFEDQEGRSLVLVRSTRGVEVIERARVADIKVEEYQLEALRKTQAYQWDRNVFALARAIGFVVARKVWVRFRGYPSWRFMLRRPLGSLRQGWGTYRRARTATPEMGRPR